MSQCLGSLEVEGALSFLKSLTKVILNKGECVGPADMCVWESVGGCGCHLTSIQRPGIT